MDEPRSSGAPDAPDSGQAAGGTPHAAPAPKTYSPLSLHHYSWLFGGAAVLLAAFYWLGNVLAPFMFAAILGYIGNPAVNAMAKRGVPRAAGATLVIVGMGLLTFGLVLILVPLVQKEIGVLIQRVPNLAARLNQEFLPWLNTRLGTSLQLDAASLRELVTANLDDARVLATRLLASLKVGGAAIATFLATMLLVPVVMFYLLRDWNDLVARGVSLVPRRWTHLTETISQEVDAVLAEFLRGQLSVMFLLAFYYAVGLWLVGLEFAVPIGVLTGLLVFVPYLGFGLGFTLGMLAAVLQFPSWHGLALVGAVYGFGQVLESFVLTPWLVGERIGLHPLAVIFALMAFGQVFGFVGVLLALPASAALLIGLRHLRSQYLRSPLYDGS